jgi:hypothetical protein
LSWWPALAYGIQQERFLWCGAIMYDAFVVRGEYNFALSNFTYSQLLNFVQDPRNNAMRLETSSRNLLVRNLEPGAVYSILVTARTEIGIYSINRAGALLKVATRDAKLNANFTRMVPVPFPSDTFDVRIAKGGGSNLLEFSGNLPSEVVGLKRFDFVYVTDSFGNVTMVQLLNIVGSGTINRTVWAFSPSDLGQVFDELDFHADGINTYNTYNDIDIDLNATEKLELARKWNATNENVKLDVCAILFPGSTTGECLELGATIRRLAPLLCQKWFKEKFCWRPPDSLTGTGPSIGHRTEPLIKKLLSLKNAAGTLLYETKYAKFVSSNLEIGVQGAVTGSIQLSIEMSSLKDVQEVSLRLFGYIDMTSYVYLTDALFALDIQSPPLSLFSFYFPERFIVKDDVLMKEVSIFVDNGGSAAALVRAAAVSDGQSLVWASKGYDFDFTFSYSKQRNQPYQKSKSVRPRVSSARSKEFYQRVNAETEVTLLFEWDVSLCALLQASVAIDLAINTILQVGTNVEALVVTDPYFYKLNAFRIGTWMRARTLVGKNNDVRKIFRDYDAVALSLYWRRTNSFELPLYQRSSNAIPSNLQFARLFARSDPKLANASIISLQQLNDLVPDRYTGIRGIVSGLDRDFAGFPYIVFSDTRTITERPTISWSTPGGPKICSGTNAITLTVAVSSNSLDLLPGKLTSGLWFGNFDPRIFVEDSAWTFTTPRDSLTSITMSLPRSGSKRSDFTGFEMPPISSIILRATLDTVPTPYSIYEEFLLNYLFSVPKFECCTSAECGTDQYCDSMTRMCYDVIVVFEPFP